MIFEGWMESLVLAKFRYLTTELLLILNILCFPSPSPPNAKCLKSHIYNGQFITDNTVDNIVDKAGLGSRLV